MGRRSETGGVRPHRGGIQLRFTWRGREWRPTLRLAPSPANLKHAARLRADAVAAIAAGTFDYAKWFPDSKAAPPASERPTFGRYAELWMASLTDYALSTKQDYQRALDRAWLPDLKDIPVADIRYSKLVEVLGKQPIGGKHRNNTLIPLRQVFDFAKLDHAIAENPAAAIRNSKVQKPPVDPLELPEVEAVLADLAAHQPAQTVNYFTFLLFAGVRPSEAIALRWPAVDFTKRTARVQAASVRGQAKVTKTHSVRDVELTDRAYEALLAQKAHTFLAGAEVFHNPRLGRAWHDDQSQMEIWRASLKRCGLRHRDAYQCRHTFATLALMAGANPMWVARQLGHANMGMLLKVYGKWLDAADKGRERAKLDSGFRTNVAPKSEKSS